MRKQVFAKIKRALKNAETALIAAHIDPDGDAIGSAIAAAMLLEKLGITATIYSRDGAPKIYRFLPGSERIKKEIPFGRRFDVVIMVDSSGLDRAGDKINPRELAPVLINIDHHPDNTLFGDINYVEKSSSVGEQIYELSKYFKVEIDRSLAICLYIAVMTDTGNFRYENTTVSTFLMAADLLRRGVNTHEITTRIYDTKNIPSIKISALALSQLEFSENRKIAWSSVTEEMMKKAGAKGEDLIGIVDDIRSIEGVEVAVFFREEKNKIKINFRSKERINVSEIAKRFGGGGHVKAAGAIVEGAMEKVTTRVITETLKYLNASKYLA